MSNKTKLIKCTQTVFFFGFAVIANVIPFHSLSCNIIKQKCYLSIDFVYVNVV
jgi:hypothetical protein